MTEPWLGTSNTVLYSLQRDQELNDAVVTRIARAVLEEPLWDLTPEQEYAALAEALRSDAQLTGLMPGRHNEEEYRDFLRRLLARLDAMRPWPEPPFRPLGISHWDSFAQAQLIARLGLDNLKIQERLRRGFSKVEDPDREVLMLRLTSGDEIALVNPWWPGSTDTAVLQGDPGRRPQQVLAAFLDATPFTADEVTPLFT
jgi:hypothetical protein